MRVAAVGHRWNRIEPESEGTQLAVLLRKAMHELPGSNGCVTLVTGMAEGTDLTAAAVRPSHWRLEAALALPEPLWRDHLFTASGVRPEDCAAYDRLISDASVVIPGTNYDKPDYVGLADYLATTCSHFLTVWNGENGPPGGTSDVVSRVQNKGVLILNLWPSLAALRHQ